MNPKGIRNRKQPNRPISVPQVAIITWKDYKKCNDELIEDSLDDDPGYTGQTPEEYINMEVATLADEYTVTDIRIVETTMAFNPALPNTQEKWDGIIATIHYIKHE